LEPAYDGGILPRKEVSMCSARGELLSTTAARDRFSEIVDRAASGKERVVLTRRGKPVVAVVPIEDLELLVTLEDERDSEMIHASISAWEAAGRPGTSLEDYIRERALEVGASED
jgi:prevent-host-death family protein